MQYNVTSRGVGARHCRAPTGVPHVNDNCYMKVYKDRKETSAIATDNRVFDKGIIQLKSA
ncbi:MAG: hypothetical protein V7K97_20640 [Nostoc sp.]|uniref:hypothetical protein n=1 Tax=Nostoc sp. TaxID=1180 RepID=UPI002FF50C02